MLQPSASTDSLFGLCFVISYIVPVFHKEAAASTAPMPLKRPGFVISICTGYFHSMYLVHPVKLVNRSSGFPGFRASLTPVCGLAAKVFAQVWYEDHCEKQLKLL